MDGNVLAFPKTIQKFFLILQDDSYVFFTGSFLVDNYTFQYWNKREYEKNIVKFATIEEKQYLCLR